VIAGNDMGGLSAALSNAHVHWASADG
jgi:hypothetical protein